MQRITSPIHSPFASQRPSQGAPAACDRQASVEPPDGVRCDDARRQASRFALPIDEKHGRQPRGQERSHAETPGRAPRTSCERADKRAPIVAAHGLPRTESQQSNLGVTARGGGRTGIRDGFNSSGAARAGGHAEARGPGMFGDLSADEAMGPEAMGLAPLGRGATGWGLVASPSALEQERLSTGWTAADGSTLAEVLSTEAREAAKDGVGRCESNTPLELEEVPGSGAGTAAATPQFDPGVASPSASIGESSAEIGHGAMMERFAAVAESIAFHRSRTGAQSVTVTFREAGGTALDGARVTLRRSGPGRVELLADGEEALREMDLEGLRRTLGLRGVELDIFVR